MTHLTRARAHVAPHPSNGLTALASGLLVLSGAGQLATGLLALTNGAAFAPGRREAVVLSLSMWGPVHLMLGAALLGAGLGLPTGARWTRPLGAAAAPAAVLANFLWAPHAPVAAVGLIAASLCAIWAIAARDAVSDR
mgnify:CR=1 FL=1